MILLTISALFKLRSSSTQALSIAQGSAKQRIIVHTDEVERHGSCITRFSSHLDTDTCITILLGEVFIQQTALDSATCKPFRCCRTMVQRHYQLACSLLHRSISFARSAPYQGALSLISPNVLAYPQARRPNHSDLPDALSHPASD